MNERTFWFTGLSGAGKTTLSAGLARILENKGHNVHVLDGDEIRKVTGSQDFSKAGRDRNVQMVGEHARKLNDQGITVICSLISPYEDARNFVRKYIGVERFSLIYLESDLDTLIARDVKGLYKKAINGEIDNFTGISDPYQPPRNPDLRINTAETSVKDSILTLIEFVENIKEPKYIEELPVENLSAQEKVLV